MIAMQRSLSSPVRTHGTDDSIAPSSGAAKPSSRPSSPFPSDATSHPKFPLAPRSRSPAAPLTETHSILPLRPTDGAHVHIKSHALSNITSSRKPIIEQAAPSPPTSPSKTELLGAALAEHSHSDENHHTQSSKLVPDLTSYTNPFQTQENDGTTLEELAHLVRLSRYQERKRAITRKRLQRNLISAALSARLTRCGEIARRNLVDCFRTDDKKIFGPLYNAIHDVRKSCDELRRYALLEPELDPSQSPAMASSESLDTFPGSPGINAALGDVTPFLHEVPASAREIFLSFLVQIRTNPDYLAARLCSLSTAELNALTSFHHGLEPIESVLPGFHGRSASRTHGPATNSRHAIQQTTAIERLLSFQRHDPLSALIHTCFANSAGPDSAEDKRRTDIWATTLARLITGSNANSEHIMTCVLNIWTAMRDWAGKSNMEWFLMKILEDGAFLLDRAEDQHGTRFNVSDWTAKDTTRDDEFYDKAVRELFEIVDDEDGIGIPEGLLEMGNAILNRLGNKHVEPTRNWLVYKWLFSSFLLNVIIHPESYGMMAEYHITEYGRQKILRNVALRAQQLVVDMTWNKKSSASVPTEIQTHVESILGRFNGTRTRRPMAKLLPARSITSLRETVEVRPYLVISPADLVTMVNALFPERRPMSAHSSGMRSVAPSISGMSTISQPISMANPRGFSSFDSASMLSTSASSVISDATTSRETTQDEHRVESPQRYSPQTLGPSSHTQADHFEDDGYRLRFAIREMTANLGMDVVQGSCHPCKERWAVLFISADGNSLSTQMTYDPDEEVDEEENSSTSDTDEDDGDGGPELDKDYHQLRDSILRLVQDFEIPQSSQTTTPRAQFSNRATGIKKYRSKNRIVTAERSIPNRNPYRQRKMSEDSKTVDATSIGESQTRPGSDQTSEEDQGSVLETMLTAASSQSKAQSDFVAAHQYWKTLQQLNALTSFSLRRNGFAILLNIFSRGPRDSIRRSASAIEEYDAWLVWLKQSQERHEGLIDGMMKRLKALRDKMWYVTDVRNSAPYEQSRNICAALKTMGMPRRWNTLQRNRAQLGRGSATNYLFRTETQIMDLLSASDEQGGPNKLSDDQADKTIRWLQQSDVANFCGGEERIHRFCCEIDACISKLVGESIMESPVLWSSELFLRDRKGFESSKNGRDKEHPWAQGGDDAASIISEPDRRYPRQPPFLRDLRSMSNLNSSQQSFDSGSYRFSKASTTLSDIVDGPDYFGVSSPVHTIDSTSTFYSPFQSAISPSSAASRAHSPTTSVTNLSGSFGTQQHHMPSFSGQSTGRPGTAASSTETVYQQRLSEEKSRFLADLKQTVLNLLLSDLGNLVFSRGSETDTWFESWGQDCIDRRSSSDKRTKRASKNGKLRVIEKKKSFNNLRGAGENDSRSETTETSSVRGNETLTTNDTTPNPQKPAGKGEGQEFPFKKAFQRLLRMFSVHPSPYGKLNALFELEQLIVASLGSGSRRSRLGWAAQTTLSSPSIDSLKESAKTKPLDEVIDNVRERRSHALLQSPVLSPVGGGQHMPRATGTEARSVPGTNAANTDAITEVLINLLRDPSIRPHTLFRDLQFVAAFVHPTILDKSDKGKAFWNTGLAALRLKSEVCRTMLKLANEVQKRSIGGSDRASESSHSSASTPIGNPYSLADAGRMWTVLAKEGNPVAQRELALFYLMDPELVERTTLPLSRPREVFKQSVMDKYDRGGAQNRAGARDRGRTGAGGTATTGGTGTQATGHEAGAADGGLVWNDPALMCIAIHFFQAAEQGGDELATSFMRQNDLV
ncbi:hypothetical protein B0T11DRAFT_66292 [Plectosphaerella cucumerina]|uniref:Uncharacterized protein n=1 Tax=Plectosphaerella cucumerina TaxID=40658 RepID=A0A8K0X690_9PEZI|nr:hypothetical protein B0T11DRAFT_66292 [Plectosphaerella cucumerina]